MISLNSPVETRAHGWPAGAKLSTLCLATMLLFWFDDLGWHMIFFAAMVILYALPGYAFLRAGLGVLWWLWPFVGLIVMWHLLINDLGPGLVIVLRMLTAVGLANLVTMTTRLTDLMGVVRFVLTPLRRSGVNTGAIELAVAMVLRFTPTLVGKGQLLIFAWRARARRKLGWQIVIPFAVLAIDDAERLADALRARGGVWPSGA